MFLLSFFSSHCSYSSLIVLFLHSPFPFPPTAPPPLLLSQFLYFILLFLLSNRSSPPLSSFTLFSPPFTPPPTGPPLPFLLTPFLHLVPLLLYLLLLAFSSHCSSPTHLSRLEPQREHATSKINGKP